MNAKNRAVLIIDEMPTECIECQFCRVFADNKPTETRCILTAQRNEDGVNTRAEWCPLRPLPKKTMQEPFCRDIAEAVKLGWDLCLDEIMGDKE